jgi:hypothetical protein
MIYTLGNGRSVDTNRDLNIVERNFIQKMMIYQYLNIGLESFRGRWRSDDSPVWNGPSTLDHPGPAVEILLDLERKLEERKRREG